MRDVKNEKLSWCECCGKRRADTLEDTVRKFFEEDNLEGFEKELWELYENAVASEYGEDYTPAMKGQQAFFYRHLLEFIRRLDQHNELNESNNAYLLVHQKP